MKLSALEDVLREFVSGQEVGQLPFVLLCRDLAQEEGVRAMADIEQRAMALRKNMQRLRALREAKEAEEAVSQSAHPEITRKKRRKPLSR